MTARVMAIAFALLASACGGKTAEHGRRAEEAERRASALLASAERNLELLDLEQAHVDLAEAMRELDEAHLGGTDLAARTHVWLAVVHASGYGDRVRARDELAQAYAIDASIEIPPDFRTPDLADITIEARRRQR